MFPLNTFCKVRLDAKKVKPSLRGQSCEIIQIIGNIAPFHYRVLMSDQTEKVFHGDELCTVFQYDMELLHKMKSEKD